MLVGLGLVALVACGFLEKPLERLAASVLQAGALWALGGAVLMARWEAKMASRSPMVVTRPLTPANKSVMPGLLDQDVIEGMDGLGPQPLAEIH